MSLRSSFLSPAPGRLGLVVLSAALLAGPAVFRARAEASDAAAPAPGAVEAPLPTAPASPEVLAYRDALAGTVHDWGAFAAALEPVARRLTAFDLDYRRYRELVSEPDARLRAARAGKLFGWNAAQAPARVNRLGDALRRLHDSGFPARLEQTQAILGMLREAAPLHPNVVAFARSMDPGVPGESAGDGLRRLEDLLARGGDALAEVSGRLPPAAALVSWADGYRDAEDGYAAAVGNLEEGLLAFPRAPLCAEPGRWTAARRAFLNAAVAPPDLEDCGAFLASAAWPLLDGVAFEAPEHVYFFDPGTRNGYLFARHRAALLYAWHALLAGPPPLDPAWMDEADRTATQDAVDRADALHQGLRLWSAEDSDGLSMLGVLGLTADARARAALDDDTFRARYLFSPGFADSADVLAEAHENHALAAGRVTDALTGAPLRGASVRFEEGGESAECFTDSTGAYLLVFPGTPGAPYRTVISAPGYQTLTETGPLRERLMTGHDLRLSPAPLLLAVSGHVYYRGTRPARPVAGAVVTGGSPRGTMARAVTGADGAFTFNVQTAVESPVSVAAERGGARASALVHMEAEGRGAVDLYLDPVPGDSTTGAVAGAGWDVDDEGADEETAAATVVAPPPVDSSSVPPSSEAPVRAAAPGIAGAVPDFAGAAPGSAGAVPDIAGAAPGIAGAVPDFAGAAPGIAGAAPGSSSAAPAARYVADGAPFRQTTGDGSCGGPGFSLELQDVVFPPAVMREGAFAITGELRYLLHGVAPDSLTVTVKAFFFDADPQVQRFTVKRSGSRKFVFTFPGGGLDFGRERGRAGLGAGARLRCREGGPAEEVTAALLGYRREAVPTGN